MGGHCYGCRRLEFVTARISRIQFAQRYVMCIYGGRITFVLFAPVPETEQPDFILDKIPCRVDAFCACARKGLAN